MKQVPVDLKAKPSIRAGKDWDLTENVCSSGSKYRKEKCTIGKIVYILPIVQ